MSNNKPLVIKLFTKGLLIDKTNNEIFDEIKDYLKDNKLYNIDFNNNIKFYNCNSNNTVTLTQKILEGNEKDAFLFLGLVNLNLITKSYIDFLILKYATLNSDKKYYIEIYLLNYINSNLRDNYINPDTNNTLFHYACQNGHIEIIKKLFKKFDSFDDANKLNNEDKSAYNIARDNYGNNHPVMKLLHNFKWIKSDITKIKSLEETIDTLKRKCKNYENNSEKKLKTTHNFTNINVNGNKL